MAAALSCPSCGTAAEIGARFCTVCGNPISAPTCASCGQQLERNANFCISCGAPVLAGSKWPDATALDSVVAALEMALCQTDPRRALQASTHCLNKQPSPAQAGIASAVLMSCHARLGNFREARSHLISARCFYADHLTLPEQQRARFLRDGCFIDDLQAVGNRDLQENPWLYFVLGHSYGPLLYEADAMGERLNAALRGWAEFVSDNRERMFGALAYLYFSNGKYAEAAKYLERVLLIARRYHAVAPVRIELIWPRVILGDCYWVSDQKEMAAERWRSAAAVELCVSMDPNIDDWERFAIPWIEKAKSRLTEHNIPVPAPEVSRKASEQLRKAIEHIFEAEQFEGGGVDLEELSAMVRQAGKRYTAAIERAASALELVERLDPFTWAKSPHEGISYWYTYENAKG